MVGRAGRGPPSRSARRGLGAVLLAIAIAGATLADAAPLAPVTTATFLGGVADDVAFMAATDAAGNVYVTGWTDSPDLPVRAAAQSTYQGARDAFVAKYAPDGTPRYVTYLGGSGADRGYYIRARADGTVSVVGQTSSANFPRVAALQPTFGGGNDGFLTVLSPEGAIVTSTFLGGRSFDAINVSAVRADGDILVAGNTTSANFPVTPGAQQPTKRAGADAFVARLDPLGRVVRWSTFLGGAGSDKPYGIAVDVDGNVTVACLSDSANFPVLTPWQRTYAGGQDVTVTGYTPAGTMRWSTYFGGSGLDRVNGVDVDPAGNVFLAGQTSSTNLPTKQPLQSVAGAGGDGFVASYTRPGALRYATYVGGARNDWFGGVVADGAGRAYAVGGSASRTVPVPGAVQSTMAGVRDGYVILLGPTGNTAVFGTFLGGTDADGISSAALAPDGSIWLVGRTLSVDFPTMRPAQPAIGGLWDGSVVDLGPVP